MTKHFINPRHKQNYLELIEEDGMSFDDTERASLFYIISGNEDLYKKRRYIYHPEEHCIRSCPWQSGVDFSSGMRSLIRLGYNLYNGWSDEYTTPIDLFGNLDEQNRKLAQNALLIRFNDDFYHEIM
jgi:hypothetical protein